MARRRVSMGGSLGIIAILGGAFAALKSGSSASSVAILILTLGLLLTALLGVLLLKGNDRAFPVGAAVLGWGFLLIANNPLLAGSFHDELVYAFETWHRAAGPYGTTNFGVADDVTAEWNKRGIYRIRIALNLLTLLFALGGGLVARGFAARTEQSRRIGIADGGAVSSMRRVVSAESEGADRT